MRNILLGDCGSFKGELTEHVELGLDVYLGQGQGSQEEHVGVHQEPDGADVEEQVVALVI